MFLIMTGINSQIKSDLEDRVHDLETKIEVIEKIDRKDTVVINNSITVPNKLNVTYQCR